MRGQQRKEILQSSYDAMQYDCPDGHGKRGEACWRWNSMMPEVVCTKRRALVRITAPGKMVKVPW